MATQLGQLYYDLNIDDESFKAKIEAIRREIHGLDNEIISSVDGTNKLTSAWNETGKTIEQVKNQINVLKQVWDKLDFNDTAGHDALISRYKELSLVLDKNGASMDSLIQRQKEMERQMTKMSAFSMPENTIGDIRSKTNALTSERLGVSREQLGQYNKEIDRLNNLYKELSSVAKEAETPLRDLEEVLRMPSGNLNEIAQKISELKRVRGEQNQTDAQYIGNMTKIMEAESSLLSRQKEAMQIGVQRISAEQKINAELQRQPVSIEALIDSAKKLEAAYKSIDPNSALADQAKDRWMRLQQEIQKYGISIQSTAMQQRSFNQVMQMQASTGAQVLEKMRAINATRKQENINTDQGKKNISALNAEYIRLNNQLKDLGLKQLNFNERILSLGRIGNEVSGQLKQVFSLYTVERFIQRMVDVRSQFELQKTALRAILQDAGAAETIFAQVVELGLTSPFKTMEINSYVKQLAAYRIETESLFDTTKRLSDVSAGLGVDMGRLILAYGQVRAASVLRGQEVRQFTEAGIPLIEELADKFTILEGRVVSTNEVFDKISKRLVPFQMVKEVFEDMTDIGGVFYNMQEIQSETLYGKVQNLGDAFDLMFNQLGEANDGVLKGTVDVLWKLADNWEYIAAAIKTAVAAYGTYRVAIISTTALSKILTLQNTLLATTFITLRNLSLATKFGLIAAGVAGVVAALSQFNNIGKSTAEITSDLAEATEKYINGTKQIEKAINTYEELSNKTKLTANEQKRLSAITNELSKRVPEATQAIDGQTEALKNQHGVLDLSISKLREYVSAQNSSNKTEAENALKEAKDRLSKLQDQRADLYKRQALVAGGGAGEYIWRDAGSVTDAYLTDAQKKRRDIIDADIATTEQSIVKHEQTIENLKVVAEELVSGWRRLAVEAAGGDKSLMPNNDEDLIAYADRLADMKKELKDKLHTTENVAGYGASDYKEQLRIIDEIVKSTKLRIDSEKSLSTEQNKIDKEAEKARKEAEKAAKEEEKRLEKEKEAIRKAEEEKLKLYQDSLKEFETYAEARLRIEKHFKDKYDTLIAAGGSAENVEELNRKKDEALKAIDEQFGTREESFKTWAIEITNMSLDQLTKLLDEATVRLDVARMHAGVGKEMGDSNKVAEYRAQIIALNEQIKAVQRENNKVGTKGYRDWKRIETVLSKVGREFEEIANAVGGTAGELISFAGELSTSTLSMINGIRELSDMSSKGIAATASGAAKAMAMVEKASVILTIISAAMQILKGLDSIMSNAYEDYLKFDAKIEQINSMADAVSDYEIAVLKARHAEDLWFGGDELKSLKALKEEQTAAREGYYKKLYEQQAIYKNEGPGGWMHSFIRFGQNLANVVSGTTLMNKVLGTNVGKWFEGDYEKGTTAAIENMRIETRKKSSGFLGIGGKSQKTQDLRTWVKSNLGFDLFDKDGWLNEEAYDVLMEKYSEKLMGQTAETLKELKEFKEQYDEYQKQLRDYVNQLYEPLVDNMVDSLWDWLDNGKNALDSFKEYASETFRDIVSDMLKTIILDKVVGGFGDSISDLYDQYNRGVISEDELARQVADRTGVLIDSYEKNLPVLENLLTTIDKQFGNIGIDIAKPDESASPTDGQLQTGIARASQESIDMMTGFLMSTQGMVSEIRNNSFALNMNITAQTHELKQQTYFLNSINRYSKEIRDFNTELPEMAANIASLVSKGIKIKDI